MDRKIALIGFGEAGSSFANAAGWEQNALAFDIAQSRHSAMEVAGVIPCADMQTAVAGVSLVLSLVTPEAALAVSQEVPPLLAKGAFYCDMNSVAPDTKRVAARAIEATGAHYVDVAILAPVNPARLNVPLLVSGPAASEARAALEEAGFANVIIVGDKIGRASTIKMIRSVMIKGIEALTAEMLLAADKAGVTREVLSSLDASKTPVGWQKKAEYNIERMTSHGLRRAAEMEEVAKTLAALGVEPVMTKATMARQREMAGRDIARSTAK